MWISNSIFKQVVSRYLHVYTKKNELGKIYVI